MLNFSSEVADYLPIVFTFRQVRFINPANKIVTNLSGDLTDNIRFENATPPKPEGWETNSWKKK